MYSEMSDGEVYGGKVFNWAIIVGAAAMLLTSTINWPVKPVAAPVATVQLSAAPIETVVVIAPRHKPT